MPLNRNISRTQSIPVSMKTYSCLLQSSSAYSPIVFEFATQTNADNNRDEGSSRNTFMTTPIVLNVASSVKSGSLSSGNSSFMRTNSMMRSSNLGHVNTVTATKRRILTVVIVPWPW